MHPSTIDGMNEEAVDKAHEEAREALKAVEAAADSLRGEAKYFAHGLRAGPAYFDDCVEGLKDALTQLEATVTRANEKLSKIWMIHELERRATAVAALEEE